MPSSTCMCESSLCDHDHACTREPHPRLFMQYVGGTCPDCAHAMIESGGASHIFLRCEDCDHHVVVSTDEGIRCVICDGNYRGLPE